MQSAIGKYDVAVNNGTSELEMHLRAFDLKGSVIVSTNNEKIWGGDK